MTAKLYMSLFLLACTSSFFVFACGKPPSKNEPTQEKVAEAAQEKALQDGSPEASAEQAVEGGVEAASEAAVEAQAESAPEGSPEGAPSKAYESPKTYEVAEAPTYTVTDPSRNARKLPIILRYPKGAPSPLPLILFSHGGSFNDQGHKTYDEWGTQLAKVGYAVIHIAHTEDAFDAHCTPLKIPADECEKEDLAKGFEAGGTLSSVWYDRPRDASAVLNDLDGIEKATGIRFDRDRIGIAGHSGGAHTVMSSAGAKVHFSPSVRDQVYREPRIKAYLANSPQGDGSLGMHFGSWEAISVPVLITTGTNDAGPTTPDPKRRLDPFQEMKTPDKYQLFLTSPKAEHSIFGLNTEAGVNTLHPLEQPVAMCGIAFFDAYLRGLPEAKEWLRSKALEGLSGGIAKLSWK